jgi:hypothetical protein
MSGVRTSPPPDPASSWRPLRDSLDAETGRQKSLLKRGAELIVVGTASYKPIHTDGGPSMYAIPRSLL